MADSASAGASARWTKGQKAVVAAGFLGWMLDAFDFFVLTFVIRDIAAEFHTGIPAVSFALVLTLAMRPIGAFIFGRLADRFGRRPVLMADILLYSILGFASGFVPNLLTLLILRALFGVAMGGEWGVGASLTMESIPPRARGLVSGILQAGYPTGYLIASVVYYYLYPFFNTHHFMIGAYEITGWRGMFMLGIVPALITVFIRSMVPESPAFKGKPVHDGMGAGMFIAYARLILYAMLAAAAAYFATQNATISVLCGGIVLIVSLLHALRNPALWVEFFAAVAMLAVDYFAFARGDIPLSMAVIYNAAAILGGVFLREHWRLGLYAVALMTAFNFFSHGTQDLYPTFLQVQQKFDAHTVGIIAVIYNFGAICGSLFFGSLSERIGRRRGMVIASLLALPVIPLWVFAGSPLWFAVGSFLMQFMVQSAWGIVPVHLNELSPPEVRGTFPGFVYQLGNLLASVNATIQTNYAAAHGGDYATAQAIVAGGAGIAIALLVGFGIERKGVRMASSSEAVGH